MGHTHLRRCHTTTEHGPALAPKKVDTRRNTSAIDQEEANLEGMMTNPASLQLKRMLPRPQLEIIHAS